AAARRGVDVDAVAVDMPLHELARAQRGIITTAQVAAAGYDRWTLRRIADAEGWKRVVRGAYLVAGCELSLLTTAYAHQLLNPRLVASHRTAATAHRVDGVRPRLEFTSPPASHYVIPGGRAYRAALGATDVMSVDGLRVT